MAGETERATRLGAPYQLVFDWRLNESGRRVNGRGVARIAPPYRARLDLFTENGETAAIAALVGDEVRPGPGTEEGLIPPAPLLWAALGVLHPGSRAELLGAGAGAGDEIVLRYRLPGGTELRYRVVDRSVRGAELVREGDVVERVRVDRAEERGRFPGGARYRQLAAFRELAVTLESVDRVEPYPAEIWHPSR